MATTRTSKSAPGKRLTHCLYCRWQLGKCKQRVHQVTGDVPAPTLQQYDGRIEELEDAMLKARVVDRASLCLATGHFRSQTTEQDAFSAGAAPDVLP